MMQLDVGDRGGDRKKFGVASLEYNYYWQK